VGALWQVAAADVPAEGFLPGALNGRLSGDLRAWAWAAVEGFDPRDAAGKEYVYVLPEALDLVAVRQAAAMLAGEHDFANLCHRHGQYTVRTIDSVEAERAGGCTLLTFRARSFLHEMVRRCATLLARVGRGEAGVEAVEEALDPVAIVNIPPADPRWLLLARVRYEPEPEWRVWGPAREQVERAARRLLADAQAQEALAGAVLGRLGEQGA
jgi:tRNA pseudouridine38-40 synthase